ncbi:hypothetical protein [Terriglobus tenax]|uniref:hypothetical protein n=1 Tax=Terriglobus tenax TaxID=1111115 RepID=UPI0021DF9904|nr:hypothetical protein [Terriglobus tenax]
MSRLYDLVLRASSFVVLFGVSSLGFAIAVAVTTWILRPVLTARYRDLIRLK